MISIGCPIFRSPRMAAAVLASLRKHTPHLSDGRAEFYFIANGPTPEVMDYLVTSGARFHLVSTPPEGDPSSRGLADPWWVRGIYRSFNAVFSEANGDTCVMVSSDMAFSPGWLEALLAEQDGAKLVTSQLIEPSHGLANVQDGAVVRCFGDSLSTFDEPGFLAAAKEIAQPGTRSGGQYVPVCIPMKLWHECGGYPEGNVYNGQQYGIPGDKSLHARYARLGYPHVTALSSVVYHFVRGESRE